MPWFRALFVLAVLPAFAAAVRAQDQPSGIAADAMRLAPFNFYYQSGFRQ